MATIVSKDYSNTSKLPDLIAMVLNTLPHPKAIELARTILQCHELQFNMRRDQGVSRDTAILHWETDKQFVSVFRMMAINMSPQCLQH